MPIHLALSPDEFQTIALAWIGALTAIVLGLGLAVTKVKPILSDVATLFKLHESNSARIAANSEAITNVALSTPSPLLVRPADGGHASTSNA